MKAFGWILYIIGLLTYLDYTTDRYSGLWIMFIGWFLLFKARVKDGNTTNKNPKPPFI